MLGIRDYALIFGNDELDPYKAFRLAQSVPCDALKIEIHDRSFIRRLKRVRKIPIVADEKLASIAFYDRDSSKFTGTMSKHISQIADSGADYFTCHIFTGHLSVQESVDAAHKNYIKVLGIPFMSHVGSELAFFHPLDKAHAKRVLNRYGVHSLDYRIEGCSKFYEFLILLGEAFGVDGYIGPANNPNVLRKMRRLTTKLIVATGLGRQGKRTVEEQMRTTYSILGRRSGLIIATEIYTHQNPKYRAKELLRIRDKIVDSL